MLNALGFVKNVFFINIKTVHDIVNVLCIIINVSENSKLNNVGLR